MVTTPVCVQLPPLLQEIPDPPKQLWCRGTDIDWEKYHILTVVGSRRVSEYGRAVVDHIINGLAGAPICIVSGLALGMDQLAHQAALRSGLPVAAFPGSGLDDSVIAPRTNFRLAMDIIEAGGALYSEYEPMQRAAPWTFPQRNRLMAGVAHAVLVVEATQKSGTLITSRLATEYNRDVLTVPGSIFRQQAVGPHQLLRLGAYPVTSGQDILDHFGISTQGVQDHDLAPEGLTDVEQSIWNMLGEPCSRQELLGKTKNSVTEVTIALSTLEIKGLIVELGGKIGRSQEI